MGLEFLFTFTAVAVFLANLVVVFFLRLAAPETFKRMGFSRVLAGYSLVVLLSALGGLGTAERSDMAIGGALVYAYVAVTFTTLVLVPMAMVLTYFRKGTVATLVGGVLVLALLLKIATSLISGPSRAYVAGDMTWLMRELWVVGFCVVVSAAFSIGLLWRRRRSAP